MCSRIGCCCDNSRQVSVSFMYRAKPSFLTQSWVTASSLIVYGDVSTRVLFQVLVSHLSPVSGSALVGGFCVCYFTNSIRSIGWFSMGRQQLPWPLQVSLVDLLSPLYSMQASTWFLVASLGMCHFLTSWHCVLKSICYRNIIVFHVQEWVDCCWLHWQLQSDRHVFPLGSRIFTRASSRTNLIFR